jgi:hypothetical protein
LSEGAQARGGAAALTLEQLSEQLANHHGPRDNLGNVRFVEAGEVRLKRFAHPVRLLEACRP